MKKIIFLCTGNSCRSQMAEGFAREILLGTNSIIESAGIRADGINEFAIQVMQEIKIDISGQISKKMSCIDFNFFDIIVTVCDHAQKNCPVVPKKKIIHHHIMDPVYSKGSRIHKMQVYRKVRDEIKQIVMDILK